MKGSINYANHYHGQNRKVKRSIFSRLYPQRLFLYRRPDWCGTLRRRTIEEQTDRACRNIGIMLEAAGTSFDKVIKANCFIADMDDFDAFNQVYARYFTSRPARTCVAVKTLPKHALCEIEVIAALED